MAGRPKAKFSKKDNSIFNPEDLFREAIIGIRKEEMSASGKTADIITFAKDILRVNLYPSQEIILKFFYKNSRFNENLEITQEDIEEMQKWSIEQAWIFHGENSKLKSVNEKKKIAKDLILVLGRRSGKTFISSLISVYEAYKLLDLKDPQKFYNIDSDIYIINTAVTKEQALSQIFKQISKFVNRCPYFNGRICKEIDGKIVLYTEADLERIKNIEDGTGKSIEGSVVILSGTSNSPALRGHSAICVVFDEMAHYFNTDGSSSSKEVYNAISRSTLTFAPKDDGRNVVISSPDKKNGFFYDHYERCKDVDTVQVFQIPTVDANPEFTVQMLDDEYLKDPVTAASEFGAIFRTVGGNTYFPPDKIDEAFHKRPNMFLSNKGLRGYEYYLHIDPATSSDNWAILIAHPEWRWNNALKGKECIIVEDYSCFWKPPAGGHLDENEIMDKHILPLCKSFNFVSVTYDNWFSLPQRTKLNEHRIPHSNMAFSGRNKNNMYSTVKDMLIQGRLELCRDDSQLEGEMKAILVDYGGKYPVISKDRNNKEFPNDDMIDCLVGVVYRICQGSTGQTKLPRSVTAFTGRR